MTRLYDDLFSHVQNKYATEEQGSETFSFRYRTKKDKPIWITVAVKLGVFVTIYSDYLPDVNDIKNTEKKGRFFERLVERNFAGAYYKKHDTGLVRAEAWYVTTANDEARVTLMSLVSRVGDLVDFIDDDLKDFSD